MSAPLFSSLLVASLGTPLRPPGGGGGGSSGGPEDYDDGHDHGSAVEAELSLADGLRSDGAAQLSANATADAIAALFGRGPDGFGSQGGAFGGAGSGPGASGGGGGGHVLYEGGHVERVLLAAGLLWVFAALSSLVVLGCFPALGKGQIRQ